MKTIINENINEIIIKNSRFITLIYKFYDDSDLSFYLDKVKEDYPKATHYCYSYITENKKKSSDDGEPGGTAGMPMLNILEKEDLVNVLAITVRYFGGIKLGAGGLVRAYAKSIRDAILEDNLVELQDGYLVEVTISYDEQKALEYKLKNAVILNKDYIDKVIYKLLIPVEDINLLDGYSHNILEKRLIEKTK